MYKIGFTIIFCLFVSSCVAPGPNINQSMAAWVGKTEGQLIASWGIPTKTYQTGNTKVLEWTNTATGYKTTSNCNQYYCPPAPTVNTRQVQYWCKQTFVLEGTIVRSWKWEGNSC
jgi:hypothetical protein